MINENGMQIVLIVHIFLISSVALAFTCPGAIHHSAFESMKPIEASYTCEAPPMTYEDYFREYQKAHPEDKKTTLKDVYKKFSATGRFYCGGKMASANVTIKNNVITLAAHSFFKKDCSAITDDFSNCYFEAIPLPGKAYEQIPIDPKSLAYGSDCPDANPEDDWAVVKLKWKVPDVSPYSVDGKDLEEGQPIVGTMATAKGMKNGGLRPAITIGKIMETTDTSRWQTFRASNSTTGGSSGGAFAIDTGGESLFLKGIVKGGEGPEFSQTCLPYDSTENFAFGVTLKGRFLKKVKEATDTD